MIHWFLLQKSSKSQSSTNYWNNARPTSRDSSFQRQSKVGTRSKSPWRYHIRVWSSRWEGQALFRVNRSCVMSSVNVILWSKTNRTVLNVLKFFGFHNQVSLCKPCQRSLLILICLRATNNYRVFFFRKKHQHICAQHGNLYVSLLINAGKRKPCFEHNSGRSVREMIR